MVVYFYSINQDKEKVCFHSEGKKDGNRIMFSDLSCENTIISLLVEKDKIVLKREGDTETEMELIKDKTTKGYYKNKMGLDFFFKVICKRLEIKKNRIDIEYSMIMDSEEISSHKIWIILR